MRHKRTVSVVIGAYNEQKYIGKTLKSLMKQSLQPLEVLVVDNNSSDDTATIAREFGASVVHEKKQGYVYSVQRGLMAAKGDIIAVTDADTIHPKNWLSTIVNAFEDPAVVGVASPLDLSDSKVYSFISRRLYLQFLKLHFSLNIPLMGGVSMAIRRDILHKVGGYDFRYKIAADFELGMRLKSYGNVQFLPEIVVKSSARRFQKDFVKSSLKYTKAYFYTLWLRKPVEEHLTPFR